VVNSRDDWSSDEDYAVRDIVRYGGHHYYCKAVHHSGDRTADADKFVRITNNRGAWDPTASYVKGEYVGHAGKRYICRDDHDAAFKADLVAGKWVKTNSKRTLFSEAQRKDWLGNLNLALETMLESGGKFWIECDDAGSPFAKIRVRFFPQWELTPSGGSTPGTHFKLQVRGDGTAAFATPAADTVSVGSGCDNETIIRYMYGKLSDDEATRGGQVQTGELTKDDLGDLSAWVQSVAGAGAFTVKKIP
jgi:hypothetical protein